MDANVSPMDSRSRPTGEAGEGKPSQVISADAGTDESIAERLYANPESKEARLDRGLDESMDASDPPSSTQPVHAHSTELPASSGYDPHAEARLARSGHHKKGLVDRLRTLIGLD